MTEPRTPTIDGSDSGGGRPPLLAGLWRVGVISARRTAASPGELAVAGAFYLVVTLVLSRLWESAAVSNGGEVAGYSAAALVWYIATTECAVSAIPVRLAEEIGADVTTRRIELELLRPSSLPLVRIAATVGRILPRLGLMALIGVVFATVAAGPALSIGALLLAAPALLLAMTLNIVLQHAFAAATFWVEDAKSAWFLYQKLVFVAGGMLLPLEVLPAAVAGPARFTPFAATAYVPGRLASGHVEPGWLLVQAGWLVLALVACVVAFEAGLRRIGGRGA